MEHSLLAGVWLAGGSAAAVSAIVLIREVIAGLYHAYTRPRRTREFLRLLEMAARAEARRTREPPSTRSRSRATAALDG
jgi:hypothetical protein